MFSGRFVVAAVAAGAICGWIAVTPTAAFAAPAVLYVATAGSDSNACTTPAEPCHTIDHAISLAGTSGTTIHVASGMYGTVTPDNKNVTVVGAGTDQDTGTWIADLGAAVVVDDPAGVLTLKSLVVEGEPTGAYVTDGTLNASHVLFDESPCGLVITAGAVNLVDSSVHLSGITGASDCSPVSATPAAVTVNGGALAMVRSSVVDTKDEPGVIVNDGTFGATGSTFSDAAYGASNFNPTVHIAGGAALIARSTFTYADLGLQTTGGSTSIYDSTFFENNAGIASTSGGSYPSVFRSTFYDAQIAGPVVLAGDVLTNSFTSACTQEPIDDGYNYGTRGGCSFTASTSHNGVATLNLDPTAGNHGGPTATVAPRMPSALVDVIPADATWGPDHKKLCPAGATDQRGVSRPQGTGCDVGAVELAASRTGVKASLRRDKSVILTATVSGAAGSFREPDPVAGTMTFKAGKTTLCAARPVTAGTVTCTTTKLPPGSSKVTTTFMSSSPYLNSVRTSPVVVGTKPHFTGAAHARAVIGHHTSIKIHASGLPKPAIGLVKGKLPKGMSFSNGKGHARIVGTPAHGSAKKYVLLIRARNGVGKTTEKFTLTIGS